MNIFLIKLCLSSFQVLKTTRPAKKNCEVYRFQIRSIHIVYLLAFCLFSVRYYDFKIVFFVVLARSRTGKSITRACRHRMGFFVHSRRNSLTKRLRRLRVVFGGLVCSNDSVCANFLVFTRPTDQPCQRLQAKQVSIQ